VLQSVLWIRTGFQADPDPAFLVNVDPDPRFDEQKLENFPDETKNKVFLRNFCFS